MKEGMKKGKNGQINKLQAWTNALYFMTTCNAEWHPVVLDSSVYVDSRTESRYDLTDLSAKYKSRTKRDTVFAFAKHS